MRRTFEFDVLACPRCGGRLRLVALIEHASVVQRILRHLGLPTEVPQPRPDARRPGDSRHSRINPKTLLNLMPPGEGVASRGERSGRGASFLFRDDDSFRIPDSSAKMGRRQRPYPRCRGGGEADEGLRTGVTLTARRP
jgi:uncharacterized protein YbaR (Trm112 family)